MKYPELLPCPFCGGEAEYRDDGQIGRVQCQQCLMQTDGSYSWRDKDWKEAEANDWNTRVYQPEVQAAIERDTPKKLKRGDPILCEGDEFICQNCEGHVRKSLLKGNCCYNCGQRLDWSEE